MNKNVNNGLAAAAHSAANEGREWHAMVERDGFRVPLLGIPPTAVLQECDVCHDEFALLDVEINDASQCVCKKCRMEKKSMIYEQ